MHKKIAIVFFSFFLISCRFLFSEPDFDYLDIEGRYETAVINPENFIAHNHVYKNKPAKSFKEKGLHNKAVFKNPLTVFYPLSEDERFPLVIIGHGWGDTKKVSASLARFLASHGYITVIFSAKKWQRPEKLLSAFEESYRIMSEAVKNPQSLLFEKTEDGKTAVIGHSMGGSAALYYAKVHSDIDAVIAFNPYNGASHFIELIGGQNEILGADLQGMRVPLLIITGDTDEIAYPAKTFEFCKHCSKDIPLAFFSIKDGRHIHPIDKIGGTVSGSFNAQKHGMYRILTLSWLELFLKDERTLASALYLNAANFEKIKPWFHSRSEQYPPYLMRNIKTEFRME